MSNKIGNIPRYNVRLELTIETEKDMETLTRIIHGVVKGLTRLPYGFSPPKPEFPSVEIEQIVVKRLKAEEEP